MHLLHFLHELETFADVPENQLQWLIDHSSVRNFKPGESVFAPNEPADEMYIVLEGIFEVHFVRNGQRREAGTIEKGDITGLLPYSRMKRATGNGVAKTESSTLCYHRKHFPEMITQHFELTQALVHVMTNRIRTFTTLQIQNEKLMSLGKLSAGLAHELNNPASAIVRSAHALRNHLKGQPHKFKKIMNIKMSEQQVDEVNDLLFSKINSYKANKLSIMDRADKEDELYDWLENEDFENANELIENLVEFGFETTDLQWVKEKTGGRDFAPVLGWMESNLSTEKMVEEIQEASVRIADLIQSIKSYSHMDRATDRQQVDLHEGLRSTITMLKHKIKKHQIQLEEQLAADLPAISGFPGELNQVFTNIIDNAIDALAENEQPLRKITFRSTYDSRFVRIFISDNGPGIPPEVVHQIFDPFFTTKEMGKGTGLGLDVVMKIVRQHKGDVKVKSQPGATEFEICLPLK